MLIDLFTATDSSPLLAYIDPGLGSMQLQIVIAALLSASFFVKSSYMQARSALGRLLKKAA